MRYLKFVWQIPKLIDLQKRLNNCIIIFIKELFMDYQDYVNMALVDNKGIKLILKGEILGEND